ncbi:MAG: dTDP-4-dehydrorhamnose 3,5-epimerase [Pseudomonadota bacterium]|nr:dTDP-4-dehydrorhamnose 3,5-epimerase [Pseudomonadota bacterium]
MYIQKTHIADVFIIEPRIMSDERGYFFESFNKKDFATNICEIEFVQDNESKSRYGVVRGLHCQTGDFAQAKLVRVLEGRVLDVAVDFRHGSPTYGHHVAVELSAENKRQLFIPKGFLHGFSVLSEFCIFSYKCDNFYDKASEISVRYDDPSLGIDWMVPKKDILVSDKDRSAGEFQDVISYR